MPYQHLANTEQASVLELDFITCKYYCYYCYFYYSYD